MDTPDLSDGLVPVDAPDLTVTAASAAAARLAESHGVQDRTSVTFQRLLAAAVTALTVDQQPLIVSAVRAGRVSVAAAWRARALAWRAADTALRGGATLQAAAASCWTVPHVDADAFGRTYPAMLGSGYRQVLHDDTAEVGLALAVAEQTYGPERVRTLLAGWAAHSLPPLHDAQPWWPDVAAVLAAAAHDDQVPGCGDVASVREALLDAPWTVADATLTGTLAAATAAPGTVDAVVTAWKARHASMRSKPGGPVEGWPYTPLPVAVWHDALDSARLYLAETADDRHPAVHRV